jgi:nickel-dependent lactate racemase
VEVVNQALDQPTGGRKLAGFSGVKSAAIAISDKTRPVPHEHLLPPLLKRLGALGIAPEHTVILIATGTHPPMSQEEFARVVPVELLSRYPVICHNAEDQDSLVYVGQTARGTPVWINRRFAEAEMRIAVGNIEPHQFMGFSGGVKSAVIGLGGKETITRNHSLMTAAHSKLGEFDRNPARQDVEDMGRLVQIHFALNAILNDHKQIVEVIAGEPEAVMRKGIPRIRELYQVSAPNQFDMMIVSPGGHPKDINMYQSQKGLAHAALVTKSGGTILLLAACPEGAGSEKYEKWLAGKRSFQDVFDQFSAEGFRLGPHKAFQVARDAARVRVLLLSDMAPDLVRKLLLTPVGSLAEGLALAQSDLPPEARIGVMPLANATIPVLNSVTD